MFRLTGDPGYAKVQAELARKLRKLADCKGRSCALRQ